MRQELLEILAEIDNEFVPALSSRSSTKQQDFHSNDSIDQMTAADNDTDALLPYLEAMYQQQLFVIRDPNTKSIVAISSAIPNYEFLEAGIRSPGIYISTIATRKHARGKGLANLLYDAMEQAVGTGGMVSTRTWSGNEGHLGLLAKRGYHLSLRLPNDRGPGIDTVYYQKIL